MPWLVIVDQDYETAEIATFGAISDGAVDQ